jgi:hypothetical protein
VSKKLLAKNFPGVHSPHALDWLIHEHASSVIVGNLDGGRPCVRPDKANAPLIVDSIAPLTSTVAFERLKPITRRRTQEIQGLRGVEHRQLPGRNRFNRAKAPRSISFENRLRAWAAKGLDHCAGILRFA